MGIINTGWTPENAYCVPKENAVPRYDTNGHLLVNDVLINDTNMNKVSSLGYVYDKIYEHSSNENLHVTSNEKNQYLDKYTKEEVDNMIETLSNHIGTTQYAIITLITEVETLKQAEISDIGDNIIIEDFTTIDDIIIEKGTYDSSQKKIYA